jgi:hypothetical protein
MTATGSDRTVSAMELADARRQLSATHQLALRCVADGDDDLVAAERLGVPFGRLTAVVAEAGAALHRLLTDGAEPQAPEAGPTGPTE